jgi:hypothetical protein
VVTKDMYKKKRKLDAKDKYVPNGKGHTGPRTSARIGVTKGVLMLFCRETIVLRAFSGKNNVPPDEACEPEMVLPWCYKSWPKEQVLQPPVAKSSGVHHEPFALGFVYPTNNNKTHETLLGGM